ncbi:MAG: hypothetical protein WBQ53_03185, partial [Methylocystis sp.]
SSTCFIPRPRQKQQRALNCRIFTPAQPTVSVASLRDFRSGAYIAGYEEAVHLANPGLEDI